MIKRSIGIDIGSSSLCAVQASCTTGQFRIEKTFSTPTRRSSDSMTDMLRSLASQHGFDQRAEVAISMPHNAVFFRNLAACSAGAEQAHELTDSALEHNFPIQSDEIVAQACSHHQLPGEEHSVLTAAVARKSLHERLNTLAGTRINPAFVDAVIFAIHSTITVNHLEIKTGKAIIAYADEHYLALAITQDNNILIVRNIIIDSLSGNDVGLAQKRIAETLSNEAKITWQKVFRCEIEKDTRIYLASGDRGHSGFETLVEEHLHCQAIAVDPYARVESSSDSNSDASICVAEGLALRVLAPEETMGVNFLEDDNADVKPAFDLKKDFKICATLAAAIAVISLVGLFIRLSHLETRYTHIKNEIKEIFQQTLPEEKSIVNPLVQLEEKLQSLQKDYSLFGAATGPAEILHAITKSLPSGASINVDSMLISADSVRLTGTSRSFEPMYNWQRLLQDIPQFSTVDVQDIRRQHNGELVNFTILISLTTLE